MPITSYVDVLGLLLIAGLPIALIILIIIQHILGLVLSKEYDKIYFKPPYFTDAEVEVYGSWPLSLIRYATYIVHTGFPSVLINRRFKGDSANYSPNSYIKLSCQFWVISLLVCILSLPVILVMLVVFS